MSARSVRAAIDIEHERRRVAIFDLLEENSSLPAFEKESGRETDRARIILHIGIEGEPPGLRRALAVQDEPRLTPQAANWAG